MADNGKLQEIEAKIKELEPRKDEKEVREELSKLYEEKRNLTEPPTEFKICEIWLRQGKIFIDAQEEFWKDKCRALGLLEYCKDIIKEARTPESKIIPAKGGMMNFARKVFGRRR